MSRWLDRTEQNRTIWLTTLGRGDDIADPDVRNVVTDLVQRAVALLAAQHADIADDSPRLRYALEAAGRHRDLGKEWAAPSRGGLILAVDPVANEFSDWGDGSRTDAQLSMNDDGARGVAEERTDRLT